MNASTLLDITVPMMCMYNHSTMKMKNQLEKLAAENNSPCVSISLNTHRTFPENAQDEILLKNLLKEAEKRVTAEFGHRQVTSLLEKIATVSREIDHNYNLDSLHIYLSNDTQEIVQSALPVHENKVHISETFALRPVIKDHVRREEYMILLLSQGGVKLFNALNDRITSEVENDDFPFPEMSRPLTESVNLSESKHFDNIVREYLNKVDKAVVKVHNLTDLQCVIICTEDNYSRLMHVADKPSMYCGYASVDYNNVTTDHLSKQGGKIIRELQHKRRTEAISEMMEAVGQGSVMNDLQEIYSAAIDGRGDLLIVHEDFMQPVLMTGERTFDLITDNTQPQAIDDITSNIAWAVFSKKGRVVFTEQDKIKDLGEIVLKTRY